MQHVEPKMITTRRLLLCGLCSAASVLSPQAAADNAVWGGEPGVQGDWFDETNWRKDLIPESFDLRAYIPDGGSAYVGPGQTATAREVLLGTLPNSTVSGGHLTLDNATLNTGYVFLYGSSSLVLDNATIVQDHPLRDWLPGISSRSSRDIDIDFVSGSYDLSFVSLGGSGDESQPRGTDSLTSAPGVSLVTEDVEVGDGYSDSTWIQNGGTLTMNTILRVGDSTNAQGQFNLNDGQVTAQRVEVGSEHDFDPTRNGQGTINQYGGTFETGYMLLNSPGRYNKHGGSLHVEDSLMGTGVLDFTNQTSTLTLGSAAQLDLAGLTILNAGQTTLTGGDNGVAYVPAGYDPSTDFASFDFGGLVVEDGQPIHIQPDQDIVLSGTIDQPLTVEGTLRGNETPLFIKGPTTIRGTVDVSNDTHNHALIVDGHTSTMESGFGNFDVVVGDGSDGSRLELLGGEFAGKYLVARGVGGGTADILIDGTNGTNPYGFVNVAGDGSAGSRATITHTSGTLTISGMQVGYMYSNSQIYHKADLDYPLSATGDSVNEYHLSGDAEIQVTENGQGYFQKVAIGGLRGGGSFTQTGGSFDARHAQIFIGEGDAVTGTYDMDGGQLHAGQMYIGEHGTGRFEQDGGTVVVDEQIVLGYTRGGFSEDPVTGEDVFRDGGDGLYRMNAGSLTAGRIRVSHAGKGVFEHNGGSVQTDLLYLGEHTQPANGLAEYHLNGGNLSAEVLRIGKVFGASSTPATFIQTGGTADLGLVVVHDKGPYQLYGGQADLHGSLLFNNGAIDFGDGDATFKVAAGGFANFAAGTLLGGENATLTGEAGSVISFAPGFDTSRFASFSSDGLVHYAGDDMVVPSGFNFRAAGSFFGGITNNGTLAPGSSPGTLSVNGNLTQAQDAEMVIEIGGTDAANEEYDRVLVSGSASLDGRLSVLLYDGFKPTEDDTFAFLQSSDVTGEFNNVQDGRVYVPGGSFALNYNPSNDSLWLFDFLEGVTGDLNLDEQVDQSDLNLVLLNHGQSTYHGDLAAGDWTGDGLVDDADLQVVLDAWTSDIEPDLSIPEPTSLTLLGLGGLIASRRRGGTACGRA